MWTVTFVIEKVKSKKEDDGEENDSEEAIKKRENENYGNMTIMTFRREKDVKRRNVWWKEKVKEKDEEESNMEEGNFQKKKMREWK